jgi:hypothetical protein
MPFLFHRPCSAFSYFFFFFPLCFLEMQNNTQRSVFIGNIPYTASEEQLQVCSSRHLNLAPLLLHHLLSSRFLAIFSILENQPVPRTLSHMSGRCPRTLSHMSVWSIQA